MIFFMLSVYYVLTIVPPRLVKLNYRNEYVPLLLINAKLPVPGLAKPEILFHVISNHYANAVVDEPRNLLVVDAVGVSILGFIVDCVKLLVIIDVYEFNAVTRAFAVKLEFVIH